MKGRFTFTVFALVMGASCAQTSVDDYMAVSCGGGELRGRPVVFDGKYRRYDFAFPVPCAKRMRLFFSYQRGVRICLRKLEFLDDRGRVAATLKEKGVFSPRLIRGTRRIVRVRARPNGDVRFQTGPAPAIMEFRASENGLISSLRVQLAGNCSRQ